MLFKEDRLRPSELIWFERINIESLFFKACMKMISEIHVARRSNMN